MSRVIRGGNDGPRVVPSEVFDAREEAGRIEADARARADEILAAAHAEAEAIRAEARSAGREEGRAEAAVLLGRARTARDGALARAERDLVALAMAAAKRILGEEIALAPERVTAIVADVLTRARRARDVVVRLHPDDAAILERAAPDVAARAGRASFTVKADASIERGGCVVETDLGELDARIDVQLDALARALAPDRELDRDRNE